MVWSVKYRRKILKPEIEEYLQELVQQIAADKGFTVHLFECGECDHVHCFVSAPPKLSITASCGIIPIMWKQSDLYLKKISAVILNIRASRINSRWNVNLHPQECLGGKKNATVAQNIYKNSAGIFQYHRTYVLCSFQTLEYLQL